MADESADSSPIEKLGEAINPVALWIDIVYLCDDDLNDDTNFHHIGNLNSITVNFAVLYLISKSMVGRSMRVARKVCTQAGGANLDFWMQAVLRSL